MMKSFLSALAAFSAAITTPASVDAKASATGKLTPITISQTAWSGSKQSVQLPNGIRLAFVEAGNPAGEPVLLLHGFTDSSRAWTMVMPHLANYRLIVPDLRGHGASAKPACCYALTDFAEDSRLLLDHLGIDRAHVVGFSLGSLVAQRMAADRPNHVQSLTLIASTAKAAVERGDPLWNALMSLRAPVSAEREFMAMWLPQATPQNRDYFALAEAETYSVPLHVWQSIPRELDALPAGRHAADVTAPVTLLHFEDDQLFGPSHVESLIRAYPAARVHRFKALGHNGLMERPDLIGPVLAAALASTARPVTSASSVAEEIDTSEASESSPKVRRRHAAKRLYRTRL